MDKNAIKKYAVWARTELIARVTQKALQYGITEKESVPASATSVNGVVLSKDEMQQRKALLDRIEKKGYKHVIEEVAYTWFNRFSALRFMEVNGYLPSRVRVFTDEHNQFNPQILTEAISLEMDGLDMEKVYTYKDGNDDEGLFKYLIIVQCNALNPVMPGMFQRIADYTELLFPDNLLREGSAVQRLIEWIPEDDWKDAVQIIGWLYQFYNIEPKAEVFAKSGKISKEEIPAATQLFTPDWIVRYMVENSLGRLWIEHNAGSAVNEYDERPGDINEYLLSKWKYYIFEAEQEPAVQTQLAVIRKEYASITPEQIKCIDPCAGSGHILAYMFDVLVQIYETYGYTAREAVRSIIENNIYGLDIDDRAAQLAYFAVMMKGCQYDRRFLIRKDEDGNPDVPQPHVYAIVESNGLDCSVVDYFTNNDPKLKKDFGVLCEELHDAKEYGSILNISQVDFASLYTRVDEVSDDISLFREMALNSILPLIQVAEVLSQKYEVAVTNPPYMGNMPVLMTDYAQQNYPIYKYDAYALFIARMSQMLTPLGIMALVTGDSWLTLTSFTKMREDILKKFSISSLIGLGSSAFDAGFGTTTFILTNKIPGYKGCFVDLTRDIEKEMIAKSSSQRRDKTFIHDSDAFFHAPDMGILYNATDRELQLWGTEKLSSSLIPKAGIVAGNNDLYLRLWHEIERQKITFNAVQGSAVPEARWIPLHKGGGYRKHYGIHEYVINLHQMLNDRNLNKSIRTGDPDFYFRTGITWSTLSNNFGVRWSPKGFVYNTKGSMCFAMDANQLKYIMGYLNSHVAVRMMSVIAPNLDYNSGTVVKIPYIFQPDAKIDFLVEKCVELSRNDWDSFETSWDFKKHPLVALAHKTTYKANETVAYRIKDAYSWWQNECDTRFSTLRANEEELNRIFIDIYGLQDELTPEVEAKDVTVRKADLQRDIRSLISYAVGCMFGRYSLYKDGLIFAGEPYSLEAWVEKMNDKDGTVSYEELARAYRNEGVVVSEMFFPDNDNIIPICDDEYFDDDITGRLVKWVETVYGKETLEDNLKFVADALGGKGAPREVIRSYFLNDFYADHLKIYQKRPIYWLFDSGKKGGFKALVYMHRYQPDTIARMRTDYVHEQQARYRTAIADLEQRIASASTSERVKLNKRLKKLQEQETEIQGYEEKIHHLADQYIAIDLDDGVKANYAKFQDVLAKIK